MWQRALRTIAPIRSTRSPVNAVLMPVPPARGLSIGTVPVPQGLQGRGAPPTLRQPHRQYVASGWQVSGKRRQMTSRALGKSTHDSRHCAANCLVRVPSVFRPADPAAGSRVGASRAQPPCDHDGPAHHGNCGSPWSPGGVVRGWGWLVWRVSGGPESAVRAGAEHASGRSRAAQVST